VPTTEPNKAEHCLSKSIPESWHVGATVQRKQPPRQLRDYRIFPPPKITTATAGVSKLFNDRYSMKSWPRLTTPQQKQQPSSQWPLSHFLHIGLRNPTNCITRPVISSFPNSGKNMHFTPELAATWRAEDPCSLPLAPQADKCWAAF